MSGEQAIALFALLTMVSCGGAQSAGPTSAVDADDAAVAPLPEEPSDDASEGAAATEPSAAAEPAADAASSEEAPSEAAAPMEAQSEEEAPSDDLQSYVGTSGAYTPEYRTVTENMELIKQCYLDAIRVDPDISGTIKVRFTVNKAGKVTKATAPVNELNDAVKTCVLATIKKLKFPKRADNRTVEYPFKFTPSP